MNTKECKKCKEVKDILNFSQRQLKGKVVYNSYCKTCKSKHYGYERYKKYRYIYEKTDKYKIAAKKWRSSPSGVISGILTRIRASTPDTDIDLHWIKERVDKGKCELTGIAFNYKQYGRRKYFAPSVDRIDNNKGYYKNNCRVVLCWLNLAKQELPENLFISSLLDAAKCIQTKFQIG